MTLADFIVVMRGGNIEQTGTPLEVFETPENRFVAGFIGSPQMNFFDGVVEDVDGALCFINDHITAPLAERQFADTVAPGQNVVAGFRPEDIIPENHGIEPRRAVTIRAKIEFAEMLGNETLLFSRLGDTDFISRMQQPREVNSDETLSFKFNLDKMHLFDVDTDRSLRAA